MNDVFAMAERWQPLLDIVASIGFVAFLLISTKFVTRHEHAKTKKKVEDLSDRITKVEADVKQIPAADAVRELSLKITKLEGSIETVHERIEGMDRLAGRLTQQVDRMEEFLNRRMTA